MQAFSPGDQIEFLERAKPKMVQVPCDSVGIVDPPPVVRRHCRQQCTNGCEEFTPDTQIEVITRC